MNFFLYADAQQTGQTNPLTGFLPLILIFVVFYFLLILPQQRRQKKHQQFLNALKKGDRVITSAGIYGTIANIKGNVISLVIADGVKIDVEKSHIMSKAELVKEQ